MSECKCNAAMAFLIQLHIDSVGKTLQEKQFTESEGFDIMEAQLGNLQKKLAEFDVEISFVVNRPKTQG